MAQKYLHRREFLAAGGAAFMAATGLTIDQAMAQKGFRLRGKRPAAGGGGGSAGLLTADDLTWLGYIINDNGTGIGSLDQVWYGQSITSRAVGGETHWLTWGSVQDDGTGYQWPRLLELKMPTTEPSFNITTAPRNTFVKNWGPIQPGHVETLGGPVDIAHTGNNAYMGGMLWDEARHGIWWTYGDAYGTSGISYPSLNFTYLDDGTGLPTTYGPWILQQPGYHFARGTIQTVPSAWSDVYAPGYDMFIMGHQSSGNAGCPFGLDGRLFKSFDPTTKPRDFRNGAYSVPTLNLIEHKVANRQARDTLYKTCGWADGSNYICGVGTLADGVPFWGGADPASGQTDSVIGSKWIHGSNKQGVLYWGQLVRTPSGYTAPGDPDGYVHRWYGASLYVNAHPTENAGHTNNYCCHDQPDPDWTGSTGPGCHFRQPMGWMVDPEYLGQVALGNVLPTSGSLGNVEFEWQNHCTGIAEIAPPTTASLSSYRKANFGYTCVWEESRKRIYIPCRLDITTNANHFLRYAYLAFEVNC